MDEKTFRTDLDIFNGNSGGPVFNAKTGLVEGIVSEGGAPDYQPRGNGECWESNRLRDGGATKPWGAVTAKVPGILAPKIESAMSCGNEDDAKELLRR